MIADLEMPSLQGSCEAMCPDYQLQQRIRDNNFRKLDTIDPLGRGRSTEELATKAFERNVSGLS